MAGPASGVGRHPPPAALSLPPGPPPPLMRYSSLPPRTSNPPPGGGDGGSNNVSQTSRAQPRHKVVFDLHLQHLALYDQPDGPRPLQPPLLWQASDARGSLKFRLRTRSPPSVCLLMDDSSHEMLIPLTYVSSLRILSPPAGDGAETSDTPAVAGTTGAAPENETEAEMEARLRTGGLVLELSIIKGCKKDFRLRQPNSYVRLAPEGPRGASERDGESGAIDFTGGAARLTNLVRLTIHASVTSELSHSMTSIVIRALRVRDGQLPQPSANDDSSSAAAAARAMKAHEGNLSAEGYLKRGWRWPDHLSPSDDNGLVVRSGAQLVGEPPGTRSAAESVVEGIRNHRPMSPPLLAVPHLARPSSSSALPSDDDPSPLSPRAPSTPVPAGLLPSNLLVDEGTPVISSAPGHPSLLDPSDRLNGQDDPERTPVNRRFDAPVHFSFPHLLRQPLACPPLGPPTPLRALSSYSAPSALPPHPLPTMPSASHGRSLSLGLDMAPGLTTSAPSSAHFRSVSAGSAWGFVPDSYWEPRTRRSSVSSAAWSDSSGATDASLSSADLAYLLSLAAISPAHEYWAPIHDKLDAAAGDDRFAVENDPSAFYDGSGGGGGGGEGGARNAGESRPSSGSWSLGPADSLHGLSLAHPAQPTLPRPSPYMPLDVGVSAGESVRTQQAERETSGGPDDWSTRPWRKSVPLPPPPSALLRSSSSGEREGGAAPVLPFYPVLSSSRKW